MPADTLARALFRAFGRELDLVPTNVFDQRKPFDEIGERLQAKAHEAAKRLREAEKLERENG